MLLARKPTRMSRSPQTASLPTWQAFRWNGNDLHIIAKALRASRDEIAQLLEVGADEVEGWIPPKAQGEVPQAQKFDAYMALRNNRSNAKLVHRIDLVIEELALILVAFVAGLTNVNALASEPRIRHALEVISKRTDIAEDEIETWDPGVRLVLAEHYPGGREQFAPGTVRPDAVSAAAGAALEMLPKPKRGRPEGSENRAAHELARELACFYENNSPHRPARSVIVNTSLDTSRPNTREGGIFLKFFALAVYALPLHARDALTRDGGSIDALARRVVTRS
jgi:hypothetical protein